MFAVSSSSPLIGNEFPFSLRTVLKIFLSKMLLIVKLSHVFSDFILVDLPEVFNGISLFCLQSSPSHDSPYNFSLSW